MPATAQITIKVDESAADAAFNQLNNSAKQISPTFDQIKSASSDAGDQMVGDMGRAREGAALVTEELGVNIPRALRTVLAETPGVGAALEAAFSGLAVVGFLEILGQIPDKIESIVESFTHWNEQAQAVMKEQVALNNEVIASNQHVADLQKAYQLIGLSGIPLLTTKQQQLNAELDDANAKLKTAQSNYQAMFDLSKQTVPQLVPVGEGQVGDIGLTQSSAAAVNAQGQLDSLTKTQTEAQLKVDQLKQEITNASKDTSVAVQSDAQAAANAWIDAMEKARTSFDDTYARHIVDADDASTKAIKDAIDERDAILKATTEWYAGVQKADAEQVQLAAQTAAQQEQIALQVSKMQSDAAVAMLPPWEQSYAKIAADAQDAINKIKVEWAQGKIDTQDATSEISAVTTKEFAQMRDTIASYLESGFDAITSGQLGAKLRQAFEDMVAQMVATWALGTKTVQQLLGITFSGGAPSSGGSASGGFLGSIFGGGGGLFGGAASLGPGGTAPFSSAALNSSSGSVSLDSLLGPGALNTLSPSTAAALGIPIAGAAGGSTAGVIGSPGANAGLAAAKAGGIGGLTGLTGALSSLVPLGLLAGAASTGIGFKGAGQGAVTGALGTAGLLAGLAFAGTEISALSGVGLLAASALSGPFAPITLGVGALIGGLIGLFGGGKKVEAQEIALETQLKQQLQVLQDSYNVHGTDYASAISSAEQLRTQFDQAQNQVHQMSAQQQHDYVDQYVDATEQQITQDEAQRASASQTIADLPLQEFAAGGFTGPGGPRFAILHKNEAILNEGARKELGDQNVAALNAGQPISSSSAVHFHQGSIVVHAAPGMDVKALAQEVTRQMRNSLRDKGLRLGSAY